MVPLDASTAASFIVGLFLPLLIALIRSRFATSRFASLFAWATCFVVALFTTWLTKQFVGEWTESLDEQARMVALNLVAIAVATFGTYQHLWRPTGAVEPLERTGGNLGDTRRS